MAKPVKPAEKNKTAENAEPAKAQTPVVSAESPKAPESEKAQEPEKAKPATAKKRDEDMKHYIKAYPNEKRFLITSDGWVFLEANASDAKYHQSTLDKEIKVEVYEVK